MNLPQEWGNGTSQPVHMNIYQSKSCSKRSKLPTFRWWAKGFKRRIKWRTNTHTIWRDVIVLDEIVFSRFLRIKSDFYQILTHYSPVLLFYSMIKAAVKLQLSVTNEDIYCFSSMKHNVRILLFYIDTSSLFRYS